MNKINCSKLKMIKANKQILSTIQFDCGDNDLNEFLLKDSFKNLENSLSKIYLCLYDETVVGFFSLSADSIKINKKLEINYKTYPAIKIGRLAVHEHYQNMLIESIIIDWIVGLCLELRKDIGIRFISIDAYNHEKTINFYTKNLFEVLQYPKNKNKLTLPMYRDLCQK